MKRYNVFGLSISSDVKLNELSPELDPNRNIDLRIVRKNIGHEIMPMGEAPIRFIYDDPEGVVMIWPGAAAVRIVGPDLVEIEAFPGVAETVLPFPLLGPVMAWILHLRKFFVLHASAIAWEGHSIAFLGDKMAGKSTTAAAFLRAGAQLLTDDLLAIDITNTKNPIIQPAFPQLKLSDTAVEDIAVPGSKALPLVMEGFAKRQYRLETMHKKPVRCDTLFVIDRGGEIPEIEWFDGATAMTKLLRYSYNIRFSQAPLEMQERARYFKQSAALTNQTRIGRLKIPHNTSRLDETVEFIRGMILADPQ